MKLFRLFIFIVCIIILCVSLRLTMYVEPTSNNNSTPLVEEKFDEDNKDNKEEKEENKDKKVSKKKASSKKSKKLSYTLENITKDDYNTPDAVIDNSKGGVEPDKTPNPPKNTGSTGNADPTKGEVTNWEDYDPRTDSSLDINNPKIDDNIKDEIIKM